MMTTNIFAKSAQNTPIFAHEFGTKNSWSAKVLILGGVHGDEIEGVIAAKGLVANFMQSFPYNLNLCIVPEFNVDGVLNKTRTNGNGVDLNRNLPTKDWSPIIKTLRYHPGPFANSETENQALAEYINIEKPDFVLSLHSWFPVLNVNGACLEEAQALSRWTGYKIDSDIGYPTPGCLGTFAGLERNSPTLTYEIERGLSASNILKNHVPAILEALKITELKGRKNV